MKILFYSHVFAPAVGGTETVGRILAQEFAALGHEVRVLTQTAGASAHPFPVTRQPSALALLRATRRADVVFHNNLSARAAWPLLPARRPWIVTHHTWLDSSSKRRLLRFARNIAISAAIARALPVESTVIPDPFDAGAFFTRRELPRDRDLIFAGRLVSDKGCDLLLEALERINEPLSVTIAGDGPERAALERRAGGRARFTGMLSAERLAEEFNGHRICAMPSRWNEPFGVTALEAIACGCAVIGSAGGGLPDAIGRCGTVFPNGDADGLARAIGEMLGQGCAGWTKHAEAHLAKHRPAAIARKYLEVFESACASG